MNLATLGHNTSNHITSQVENNDLMGLFISENIENYTQNDFYITFKDLFLNSFNSKNTNSNIIYNIENVKNLLLKQDCYDKYLFFLKYYKINLNGEEIIFFDKELFENSENLEQFLDNLSKKIYFLLLEILNKKNNTGYCGLTFTTENILISNKELIRNGLFGIDKEQGEKLLYGCIRYFILERGINFPQIKEIDDYKGSVFMEFNESSAERIILNLINVNYNKKINKKPFRKIKKYPCAKDFIIYCIENFSLTSKNKSEEKKMGEFSIANAITIYTGEHINSFSFKDMKELLLSSLDYKGSMINYILSTEMLILKDIIKGIENKDKIYIENISIKELIYFYIKGYVENLLIKMNFYLNKENNTFYLSNETFNEIIKKISNKKILTRENKIKAFLGEEVNILSRILGLLQENLESKSYIHLQKGITTINNNSDKKDIDILIEIIYNKYLIKDNLNSESLDSFIENNSINNTINTTIIKTEQALKKGHEIYNALSLKYSKEFLPIGGKIHFKTSLSLEKVKRLRKASLFESTPFKLQHSNESMLLPPCDSPFQLIAILKKLHNIGIINNNDLELQLSIPGRLPNKLSGILGSSMIFMKNYQVNYPKEAFYTGGWNYLTGSCIICYDAGVLDKEGFKNINKKISGRTDILGIKRIEEVINFSVISNLISQSYFGGPLQEAGIEFINEYLELLKKYNIEYILKGKWVHNPDNSNKKNNPEEYVEHYNLVKICTDILNENIADFNRTGNKNSLIFELKNLLGKYVKKFNLIKSPIKEKAQLYI